MFGIPGTDSGSGGGEFLGRINVDARTGFWTVTKRIQRDGMWTNDTTAPFQNPTLLMDFGSLEVGYMKISSPPVFLLVPMGKPIPQQPEEMTTDATGKQKRAFMPGFRIKVMSQKTFGDADPYYFSANSKTVMGPVDQLWNTFCASPEAAQGLIPVVSVTGSEKVQVKTPMGSNTFYAPIFQIAQWVERPASLGERLVPPPAPRAGQAAAAPAPSASAPPPNHVPPPAPKPAAVEALPF